jgi:hypothetical protein
MKYGHCRGTKKERKGSQDWYREIEEANIRRIEAEWQAEGVSQLWISSWMALSHAAQKRKSMLAVSAAQPTNTSTTLKYALFFQDGAHARSGHWVAHQSL